MGETICHLRGQYLIASDIKKLNDSFLSGFAKKNTWNKYTIFADNSLPMTQANSDSASILLVGDALHHEYNDFSNYQLMSWILGKGQTVEEIVRLLQECGGRYVAVITDKARTIAVTDACAMRQLYWFNNGRDLLLSSSARFLLDALSEKPQLDEKTANLLKNKKFMATEYAWYGDKWFDTRVSKLLANHYLDMDTITTKRLNYYYDGPTSYNDILNYSVKILQGLVKSIHYRYNVMQALTSGYDSRLLLAASRSQKAKTRYYIFDSNFELNRSADVMVATELSKKLDFNFEVILPCKLREDFLSVYREKCFFPRVLYNTAHIQWHYDFNRDRQLVNLNGNCGEIARFFYQNKAGTSNDIGHLINIAGFNGFFSSQVNAWFPGAIEYCSENSINVYDLFYWEQRMSNWCAMYRFEQDIAIDEFTPYNHKNLLLALLHTDIMYRKGPQYRLFKDLINQLWPEAMSMPFNPIIGLQIKSRAKKIIKNILGKK